MGGRLPGGAGRAASLGAEPEEAARPARKWVGGAGSADAAPAAQARDGRPRNHGGIDRSDRAGSGARMPPAESGRYAPMTMLSRPWPSGRHRWPSTGGRDGGRSGAGWRGESAAAEPARSSPPPSRAARLRLRLTPARKRLAEIASCSRPGTRRAAPAIAGRPAGLRCGWIATCPHVGHALRDGREPPRHAPLSPDPIFSAVSETGDHRRYAAPCRAAARALIQRRTRADGLIRGLRAGTTLAAAGTERDRAREPLPDLRRCRRSAR